MRVFRECFVVLSLTLVIGCGGPAPIPKPVPMQAAPEDLKFRLETFAQSGVVGSGVVGMKEAIQKLPVDKSEPLLKDFDKMVQARDPSQVKAIAKQMLEKL